jgi:phosphoenolpyruvate synthase/pyruvate phosphate dikinase
MNNSTETKNLSISSKAQTLSDLQTILSCSVVLDMLHFDVSVWEQNYRAVLQKLTNIFSPQRVIVRSCAVDEGKPEDSKAGVYRSHLHVSSTDHQALHAAIQDVIDSYPKTHGHSVFVQPMLSDDEVYMSGVASTHCLQTKAPYYTISYDKSGRTDHVTRGVGNQSLVYVARDSSESLTDNDDVAQIISVLKDLETILSNQVFEIEFALTLDRQCILFQVRPLHFSLSQSVQDQTGLSQLIQDARQAIVKRNHTNNGWLGKQTFFGVMPDWNPAEIIGLHPRPFSSSLYQSLITRNVWRQARARMGYRVVPQEDLMLLLAGRPFIDVRMSFNSLLPAALDDAIAAQLIDSWLDRLNHNPHLHDKVEFEIVDSCYVLDCPTRLQLNYGDRLSKSQLSQFSDVLRVLTCECLKMDCSSSLNTVLQTIYKFQKQQRNQRQAHNNQHLLTKASQLLHDCRTLGTPAFAMLARHAFIAESLLKSALRCNAISTVRHDQYRCSIKTVSSKISTAFDAVKQGQLQASQFFDDYGHLRPGTYDIRSLCYRDRGQLLFSASLPQEMPEENDFVLTVSEYDQINQLLKQAQLNINPSGLMHYASQAIAARELSKFVFSRTLSDALEFIALWGTAHELDREALSYLTLDDMMLCVDNGQDRPVGIQRAKEIIEQNRDTYQLQKQIKLGQFITGTEDLDIIKIEPGIANFIGNACVEGETLILSSDYQTAQSLSGKIICIESADPGYEWIFCRNIAALVTCFGGPNSHMAIRCTEFGLPAAIGCGEPLFRQILQSEKVILDCENHCLRPWVQFD